ncbi:helix-turn-helix domain-containing protein [Helicobacter pylori]|uniref:helix-turn-helix domain-containing protein n=1 Tax=Helicobacter pylori TaxID=210 RepID=UPI001E54DE4F
MFYDNYLRLCNSVRKTPSAVALEIGLTKPSVSRWKSGSMPTDATLQKVADYFGITVDELLGKEKQPTEGELHPANKKLMELSRTLSPEEAEKVYKAISLLLEK